MKIVISVTTTPKRINLIKSVLLSIMRQTHKFDILYLNIEKTIKVPYFLTNLAIKDKRFVINFCDRDYGPLTKLVPTLKVEQDPETIIVCCDDDQLWDRNTLAYFMKHRKKFPNDAISMSGWCVGNFPFIFQVCWNTKKSHLVDWIEGTNGILIRRDMLDLNQLLDYSGLSSEYEKLLYKNDDHWISYNLHRKGVNRRKIAGNASDFFKETTARSINSISGQSGFFINVFKIVQTFKFYNKSVPISLDTSFIGFFIIIAISIVFLLLTKLK